MVSTSTSKDANIKDQTYKLIAEKDKIEKKIAEYGMILEMNQSVGMTGSLVDDEGFPRNDIDVHQVRNARHQIICLQNDLKTLMNEIEKGIHLIHAAAAATNEANSATDQASRLSKLNLSQDVNHHIPIVKVASIAPGSPAEEAGLAVNDEIISFGSVNSTNFNDNLMVISEIVNHKINQNISLKVKRMDKIFETTLIPRNWSGRGLLGCHILPIKK